MVEGDRSSGAGASKPASARASWVRSILPAPALVSRQWSHALARRCREPAQVAGFIEPASSAHHIVMPTGAGFQFEARELSTGRWRHYDVAPGELCVVGAGAAPSELCWRSLGEGQNFDVIELYLDPGAVRALDARSAAPALRPEWGVLRDPLLAELLRALGRELDGPESADDLFGDLATALLAVQLGRAHGVPEVQPRMLGGGLAPLALRRVREYVAAHLAKRIRLQHLASVAGLSPYHFARAFKTSTGLSPNSFVLHCRIAEAKRLLSGSSLAIGDIARRTGFNGAGQLSTRFRAMTGTTPSAYRQLSRP
jgi:AraC family transcriptional regulator